MFKFILAIFCFWTIIGMLSSVPVNDLKPLKPIVLLPHPCPMYMCMSLINCSQWEMTHFYLEDGTKCSGCPRCVATISTTTDTELD